jgi:hypothetical protein
MGQRGFFDVERRLEAISANGDPLERGVLRRKPTTGITCCCARAATGHAARPASPVMNSRRFMGLPRTVRG